MNKSVIAVAAGVIMTLCGLMAYKVLDFSLDTRRSPPPQSVTAPPAPAATLPLAPPGAPEVAPVDYKLLAPETAAEINAAVPIQSVGPAATPFRIAGGTPTWDRAMHCLAQAVYYEARTEPIDGQRAVAQVVMNRVRSPAFPASVCGVVYQGAERATGCQFTFTCDGSIKREATGADWQRALMVATSALSGAVYAPVGHATHYHANYVVPYWAASMAKIRAIGAHDFYRWPGQWRAATYFSQLYANKEPNEKPDLSAVANGSLSETATDPLTTPALPPTRVTADAIQMLDGKKVLPAIDHSAPTLLAGGKVSKLNSSLNQIPILRADLQGNKLEPTPSTHAKNR